MAAIRMGFIGCGGNGTGHVRRLSDLPDVEMVALVEPSDASIARLYERVPEVKDLPMYSNYREMLDAVEMDAVGISSPHTDHFDQIMTSLERGLHVLTEKPMVCTVDHAKQVIAKAEEVGKTLMVSYQRHFSPTFRYIRNQIKAGEMGELQFISALQCQDWYRGTKGAWRQQLSLSGGGQLNDSGSHLLDIILWMTDLQVDEISAFMEYFESEVDINSAMSVRFTKGAMANLSIVGNSPGGMWEDITIWGEKAVVYSRNQKLTYRCLGNPETYEPTALPSGSPDPDRNFVDALMGRADIEVPATCGLRVIELTEAAWESAKQGGKPVKVKRDA